MFHIVIELSLYKLNTMNKCKDIRLTICDDVIDIILYEQAMALMNGKRRSVNQIVAKIVREWKTDRMDKSDK